MLVTQQIELLNKMPGLAGAIAQDVYRLQTYKQPLYAVQAGLSVAALLFSQRRRGYQNARTNIYSIGISGTGSGKNFGLAYISELLDLCKLTENKISTPGSKLAFTTALSQGVGASLVLWDEIGKDLGAILGGARDGYTLGIASELLKLFSCSNTSYQAPTVSEASIRKSYMIYQPQLIIHGMGTAETLFKIVTSESVSDGLLPRFLYFKGVDDPMVVEQNDDPKIADHIIRAVKAASEMLWIRGEGWKNEDKTSVTVGRPDTTNFMKFTPKAWELWQSLTAETSSDPISEKLKTRGKEHAIKVALCVEDEISIKGQVGVDALQWAWNLVKYTTEDFLKDAMTRISDTPFERDCNQIVRFLNTFGTLSYTLESDIVAAFPMPYRDLTNRLDTLVRAKRIMKQMGRSGTEKGQLCYLSLEVGHEYEAYWSKVRQRAFRG